jgi:hypothetical protein
VSWTISGGTSPSTQVSGFKASRFSGFPTTGSAAPGSADVGPVTSDAVTGAFTLLAPTNEDYYILLALAGGNQWELIEYGGATDTGTGTGGVPAAGAVQSVQMATATTGPVTVTGNATPALGPLAISGMNSAVISYDTTGFTGSVVITPQVSYDGGATWRGAQMLRQDGVSSVSTTTTVTNTSLVWAIPCKGATHVRVNTSAYVAGGTNPSMVLSATPAESPFNSLVVLQVGANILNNGGATNMSGATPSNNSAMAVSPGEKAVTSSPATNTQASASVAAGGASIRHVCRSITASFAAGATAGAATQVNLRDGATGAGTILRSWVLCAPVGDSRTVEAAGLNIIGSANTAMTLEFAAAGGATTLESCSLSYMDCS